MTSVREKKDPQATRDAVLRRVYNGLGDAEKKTAEGVAGKLRIIGTNEVNIDKGITDEAHRRVASVIQEFADALRMTIAFKVKDRPQVIIHPRSVEELMDAALFEEAETASAPLMIDDETLVPDSPEDAVATDPVLSVQKDTVPEEKGKGPWRPPARDLGSPEGSDAAQGVMNRIKAKKAELRKQKAENERAMQSEGIAKKAWRKVKGLFGGNS
jgi:hypothetical protein